MKLVSMLLPKKEKPEDDDAAPAMSSDYERPDYPYGLRISLDDEQLAALGMQSMPATGAPCSIQAIGTVLSVFEETVDGGKPNRRLEIQITEIAVVAGPSRGFGDRMYPDKPKGA